MIPRDRTPTPRPAAGLYPGPAAPVADFRRGPADLANLADAAGGPVTPYWPRWAVQFHLRLVRAGCNPRIVAAVGEAGRPVLPIEATCPTCRRPGALSAWPWTSGMMFATCKSDEHCARRQIFDALDAAAPLPESDRLFP